MTTNNNDKPQKTAINKILTVMIIQVIIAAILIFIIILLVLRKPVVEEYVAVDSSRIYEFYKGGQFIDLDDYTYGKIRVPALTDVPKHTYNFENLLYDGRFYSYTEGSQKTSVTGIDVSYFQGSIDWDKVAADGINFAIIRVGYRGYESGTVNIDERFDEYVKGATDAGIDVGVYFFSQANSIDEAHEEADTVITAIKKYNITYPVVYDWEITGNETARTNDIDVETVTDCAVAFCDRISEAGYIPMIYGTKKCALMKMNMSRLAGYHFWYTAYNEDEPSFPYEFQMWQYASDGKVDGIDGDVDLNISFIVYSKTKPVSYLSQ